MKVADTSKSEIAAKLQVSRPYISQVLRGEANMSVEAMVKFAQALNCDLWIQLRKKHKWIPQDLPVSGTASTEVVLEIEVSSPSRPMDGGCALFPIFAVL